MMKPLRILSRRRTQLQGVAVSFVILTLLWLYLKPPAPKVSMTEGLLPNLTIWHSSCSARYSARWDEKIPKRFGERRVSQCMLPSPYPQFKRRISDWADDEPWRQQEAEELTRVVQQELHALQNPSNCSRALLCSFDQYCGMGCKLHHVVHCLAMAYATRRVLVMVDSGYPYQNASWWGTYLRPLSDKYNLSHFKGIKPVDWKQSTAYGADPLTLVKIDLLTKWFPALYPVAIPRHLAGRLTRMHCAPHVWWVGQLLHFIMRPNPKLQNRLSAFLTQSGFEKPVVGVHVRHSDKGVEARFWELEYYLPHVQTFARHHGAGSPPTVFLATDDPAIPSLARTNYTQYRWIFGQAGTKIPDVKDRYNSESLEGSLLDLLLLARTDYLVCTFSSNLCRAAYELLQVRFADGSWRVTSLDQPYYVHGQRDFVRTASQNHTPSDPKEITLTVGDPVSGFAPSDTYRCQGRNERTGQQGLYPYDKVQLLTPLEDLPKLNLSRSGGR